MSVMRIRKNKNYTVMSNHHLRNKNISLKAKGLLSVMLSLPDEWDYSISGLCAICKENETAIKSALGELRENGYVVVAKKMPNKDEGRSKIEYEYYVYEEPQKETGDGTTQNGHNQHKENQGVENLPVENQAVEFMGQLNTDELNTDNELLKSKYLQENLACNSIHNSEQEMNNMYAGFPKQENPGTEKKSRFIPAGYTEEQLEEHVKPVYRKVIDGYYGHIGDGAEKDTDTLTKITVYFHRKFREKYHSRCQILSDKAYMRIAEKFCEPPICMEGVYDFERYTRMIDRYIETELNKSGNCEGEVIPSLAHFMSDTIRENLYRKTDY